MVIYRLFFDALDGRDARALARTSQASGALLPAGGVGGYAISGWLTRLSGLPSNWIIRRSSAMFFLTTAVSGAAVIDAGLLLFAGWAGPHDFLRAYLPALLAALVTLVVLWVTLHAVGQPLSVPAVILAYSIGYLANTIPIPGGIGVLDAGLTGALVLYGATPAHAAAAVLLYHAIALWIPGLGGLLAYIRLRGRLVRADATNRHLDVMQPGLS